MFFCVFGSCTQRSTLGDNNLYEIDDIDDEDEISLFSLLDWLDSDEREPENIVDKPEPSTLCSPRTVVVTPKHTANLQEIYWHLKTQGCHHHRQREKYQMYSQFKTTYCQQKYCRNHIVH